MTVRRNRTATDRLVAELRAADTLAPSDVGLVAMLRTLADLIDLELSQPDPVSWKVAQLSGRWLAIHNQLHRPVRTGLDDELETFFTGEPGGSTAIRDRP